MKRSLIAILSVGAIFILCSSLDDLRLLAQGQSNTSNAPTPQAIEARHSRLFEFGNRTVQDLASEGTGDIHIHASYPPTEYMEFYPEIPTSSNMPMLEMMPLVCDSALVVLGKMGTGTSHLTANQKFLYTDWGFLVGEVIRNNPDSPVSAGQSITVVKAGGRLQFQGRMVYAVDDNFREFEPGGEYLLFLVYIRSTGTYLAQSSIGYVFQGPGVTQLSSDGGTKGHTVVLDHMDKDSILQTARAAASRIKAQTACRGVVQ